MLLLESETAIKPKLLLGTEIAVKPKLLYYSLFCLLSALCKPPRLIVLLLIPSPTTTFVTDYLPCTSPAPAGCIE